MNLLEGIYKWVDDKCNDKVCVMIAFIFIGVFICHVYNNVDGFSSLQDSMQDLSSEGSFNNSTKQEKQVGIELKPKSRDSVPPSLKQQLSVVDAKSSDSLDSGIQQAPKLMIQESVIARPFDERWNPGFMPLDMEFKGVQKSAGPMGPMGPDRPMKSVTDGAQPESSDESDLKIVLLYAPWCGHSKKMLPDYERIKSEFHGQNVNGKNISIEMYNSDVDKDKVKEYGVKGFPSLFVEKDGKRESFPHRTYDKIAEYIKLD